jgi:mono/diheme cytochrome c family protein
MGKTIRFTIALAMGIALTSVASLAQSGGEALYKAKCMTCHGAAGMADTNVGKALKVRPISDPEVKKLSLSAQISVTKNGVGKMQGFKDKYTDAQIKEMVEYFRTFTK